MVRFVYPILQMNKLSPYRERPTCPHLQVSSVQEAPKSGAPEMAGHPSATRKVLKALSGSARVSGWVLYFL